MQRQARKESGTGMFHVMMRGINHMNIGTNLSGSTVAPLFL